MQFTLNQGLALQVILFAIQILAPAFFNLTQKQEMAVGSFVSMVQGALAIRAHQLTQDGRKVNDALAEVPAKEK